MLYSCNNLQNRVKICARHHTFPDLLWHNTHVSWGTPLPETVVSGARGHNKKRPYLINHNGEAQWLQLIIMT